MNFSVGSLSISAALLSMAPGSERTVVLEVDHTPLLEEQIVQAAEDTAYFVQSDGTKLLHTQHGFVVLAEVEPSVPAISVRLEWVDYEDSLYRVTVATRRPGEDPRVLEEFECQCVGSQLTNAILERFPAAVAQLDEEPEAPEEESGPGPAASEPGDSTRTHEVASAEAVGDRKRLGPLGWSGIAVGSVGAGVLVGGLVLSPRNLVTRGGPDMVEGRDPRSLGVGLAVTGGVALAAGVSMVVVDLVRRRPSKVAAGPSGGRDHAGVVFTLRF